MVRTLIVGLLLVGIVGTTASHAVLTTYTDESSYLAAISAYDTVTEGFESSDWSPAISGAASISSQGLIWAASDTVMIGSGWARSGSYGVYDSWGDPDAIYAINSVETLHGVGGWFRKTSAADLSFTLDYSTTPAFTVNLSSTAHGFFGVVETDGFSVATLAASDGHWGADDFTFARDSSSPPVPEPASCALLALAVGGVGAGLKRRRKK